MATLRARSRPWAVVALAVIIMATGIPWVEIHAHDESGHAPHSALEHGDAQHGQDPQDDDLHVHDIGLFGHGLAASGAAPRLINLMVNAPRFAEPAEPALEHHASRLLRPPTRA